MSEGKLTNGRASGPSSGAPPGRRLERRRLVVQPLPATALRGLHMAHAVTDDPRFRVPLQGGVSCRPLWISTQQNSWCDILMAEGGAMLPSHIHPHAVFAYTLSGRWSYRERGWTADAGDFVYEPPDRRLTLVAHHGAAPTRVLFLIHGPLIRLDEDGDPTDHLDAHRYLAMCRAHFERSGLGARHLESLLR